MTGTRAAAQPYTTSFESTVERVDGRDVWLSTSYFYPESGGQPADRGRIENRRVVDVQDDGDGVVHTLDEKPAFGSGADVVCHVDRARRLYCMRAHTASHVLYGAARRCMEELGYGGFGIRAAERTGNRDAFGGIGDGEDKVRVDFVTSTDVDDDVLVELERLANQAVWESRDVSWEVLSEAEAKSREGIVFNEKTEEGVFGADADVRVVTVGAMKTGAGEPSGTSWDVAACGGTHVRNTREIGPISVLGRSNPGEGMTRVEFAVGPRAVDHRADEKRALLSASRELGTSASGVPEEVGRLQGEVESLRQEVQSLQRDAVESTVATLPAVERDGERWLVGEVEGVDANDVEEVARDAVGGEGDGESSTGEDAAVVVLVGESGGTFVVAAASEDASVGAGDVVSDVTDEFGGGGGGSPHFAQGGGISVDPETVVDWLRE